MTRGAGELVRPRLLRWRDLRSDRGASSIELVLYTPLLMVVIFLVVQFALTWHGNQVASAVARETSRVVRAGGGTPQAVAEARSWAVDYAADIGGSALRDVAVTVTPVPAADEVRVTVSGRSVEIVRGFAPAVTSTVQGPVETFRPDL